jgi:hypothetical protein
VEPKVASTQVAVTVKTSQWQKAILVSGHRREGENVLIAPKSSPYTNIASAAVFSARRARRLGQRLSSTAAWSCATIGRCCWEGLCSGHYGEAGALVSSSCGVMATGLLLARFTVLYASFGTRSAGLSGSPRKIDRPRRSSRIRTTSLSGASC